MTTIENFDATAAAPKKQKKSRRNWLKAFFHINELRKDNDDTEHVFKIIEALKGDADETQYNNFVATEIGRKVIEEKRSAIDFLAKREELRQYPEGTLGRYYIEFMDYEGITAEGLRDVSYDGGFATEDGEETEEQRVFSEWNRDIHDLFHVICGYGRDPLGELSVLAVTYRQTGSLGVGFIALMGSFEYRRILNPAPVMKAIFQGFKIGKECKNLVAQDWEYLLTQPLDQVRADLGLRTPTRYQAVLDYAIETKTTDPRYQHLFAA